MKKQRQHMILAALVLAAPWMATVQSPAAGPEQDRPADTRQAAETVALIQRADYEGDRDSLRRLHAALAPAAEGDLSSRIHYWRGFALWRRALNGFNDAVAPDDLQMDLEGALTEFREASRRSPTFVDAKIAAISCLQALAALSRDDAARVQRFVSEFQRFFKESLAAEPENPRLLWVLGAQQWYNALRSGGTEDTALATYQKGLERARQQKRIQDSLEPAWGEPELLMSLAWGNLNRRTPDLQAAEKYAREALALVPYWKYVRDILLPQIRDAIAKALRGASRFAGAIQKEAEAK
jgi:hypothetical protein